MIKQIKESLLAYHQARGFTLYESFPLVTDDPTVLFTNATITPFKHFFGDRDATPHNYALIQRCLRVGGGAGELETARADPNYSSFFEMFGSGLFGCSYRAATEYFLDILVHIGLPKANLRFTVPETTMFATALVESGVNESSIFAINENSEFWQEWRFGKDGPVGKGITAIYANDDVRVVSIDEIANTPQSFVEIGNLIHIYGKAEGERVVSISHEGFDVGMGVERLAIILQGKTLYELAPFYELVELIAKYIKALGGKDTDSGTLRVVVDHLRSINALIQEGLRPGNKQQAFVLGKLIRSRLETMWLSVGRIISSAEIVRVFAELDVPDSATLVSGVVCEEERIFRGTLERGRNVLAKNPSLDPEILKGTYGIRQSLLPLLQKG